MTRPASTRDPRPPWTVLAGWGLGPAPRAERELPHVAGHVAAGPEWWDGTSGTWFRVIDATRSALSSWPRCHRRAAARSANSLKEPVGSHYRRRRGSSDPPWHCQGRGRSVAEYGFDDRTVVTRSSIRSIDSRTRAIGARRRPRTPCRSSASAARRSLAQREDHGHLRTVVRPWCRTFGRGSYVEMRLRNRVPGSSNSGDTRGVLQRSVREVHGLQAGPARAGIERLRRDRCPRCG